MTLHKPLRPFVAALALACAMPMAAMAQSGSTANWAEIKCQRYSKAYRDTLERLGTDGIRAEFLSRHEAFLASGCTARAEVCPQSEPELRMANTLVIRGMNEGMASTFFPFACRKDGKAQARSIDPRHSP